MERKGEKGRSKITSKPILGQVSVHRTKDSQNLVRKGDFLPEELMGERDFVMVWMVKC